MVSDYLSKIVSDYSGWHFIYKNPMTPLKLPWDRWHEIQVPALIVVGENDLEDFRDIADLLNQKIPNSSLRVISGAGHMSNMEQPKVVNKLIQDFLTQQIKSN